MLPCKDNIGDSMLKRLPFGLRKVDSGVNALELTVQEFFRNGYAKESNINILYVKKFSIFERFEIIGERIDCWFEFLGGVNELSLRYYSEVLRSATIEDIIEDVCASVLENARDRYLNIMENLITEQDVKDFLKSFDI